MTEPEDGRGDRRHARLGRRPERQRSDYIIDGGQAKAA
jgi:hypothetical protein